MTFPYAIIFFAILVIGIAIFYWTHDLYNSYKEKQYRIKQLLPQGYTLKDIDTAMFMLDKILYFSIENWRKYFSADNKIFNGFIPNPDGLEKKISIVSIWMIENELISSTELKKIFNIAFVQTGKLTAFKNFATEYVMYTESLYFISSLNNANNFFGTPEETSEANIIKSRRWGNALYDIFHYESKVFFERMEERFRRIEDGQIIDDYDRCYNDKAFYLSLEYSRLKHELKVVKEAGENHHKIKI